MIGSSIDVLHWIARPLEGFAVELGKHHDNVAVAVGFACCAVAAIPILSVLFRPLRWALERLSRDGEKGQPGGRFYLATILFNLLWFIESMTTHGSGEGLIRTSVNDLTVGVQIALMMLAGSLVLMDDKLRVRMIRRDPMTLAFWRWLGSFLCILAANVVAFLHSNQGYTAGSDLWAYWTVLNGASIICYVIGAVIVVRWPKTAMPWACGVGCVLFAVGALRFGL